MSTQIINAKNAWALSLECAQSVYGTKPPNARYAWDVARLLAMTVAHESGGFLWNRQLGFSISETTGAFGLWQIEQGSTRASLTYMTKRPDVAERAGRWLFQHKSVPAGWWQQFNVQGLAYLLTGWPRACCLFARLHYMRVAAPVPQSIEEQGAYAKRYYNTSAGKATAADYVAAYQVYIDSFAQADKPA